MKRWIVLAIALFAGGCAGIGGPGVDEDRPLELDDIDNELPVEVVWQRDLGRGAGSLLLDHVLVLEDNVLYTALPDGTVWAVSADNGRRVWRGQAGHPIVGGPGVGDDLVVVGSADGQVIALDRDSGERRWSAPVSSEVLAPPAIGRGVVVARTNDGRVYGFSARNGDRLWVHETTAPLLTLRGLSAPVIVDNRVLVGLDNGRLISLALRDGDVQWERPIAAPTGRSELERLVDIDGTPLVLDGNVYVSTYQGRMAEVSLSTGQIGWARDFSSTRGMAAAGDRLFAIDDRSRVHGLNRFSGSPIWLQDDLLRRQLTQPAVDRDYIVVGDFRGWVHWLSRRDGSIVARRRVDPFGIMAPPLTRGDNVWVVGRGGQLARLQVRD